jgi:tetratricopeptide (TPR) repeat protein
MKKNASFREGLISSSLFLIAFSLLNGCAAISPSTHYINQANQHLSNREYEQAIAKFSEAITLEPENAKAYSGRAAAFRSLGDLDRAIADYNKHTKLDPSNNYGSYLSLAYLYKEKGDYDQAIFDYTKAIQNVPTSITWRHLYLPLFGRSQARAFKDDFNNAIIDRQKGEELVQEEAAAMPTLAERAVRAYLPGGGGLLALSLGAHSEINPPSADRAQRLIDETTDNKKTQTDKESPKFSNTDYAKIHELMGYLWFQKNELDKAITHYSKAIELLNATQTLLIEAYLGRAEVFAAMKEHNKAVSDITRATEIMSTAAESIYKFIGYAHRGRIFAAMGDFEQAISDFTKAIEIAPSEAIIYHDRNLYIGKETIYLERGLSYSKNGNYDLAIDDYTQALKRRIGAPLGRAYYSRALAYYAKENYDRAYDDVMNAQKYWNKVDQAFIKKLQNLLHK